MGSKPLGSPPSVGKPLPNPAAHWSGSCGLGPGCTPRCLLHPALSAGGVLVKSPFSFRTWPKSIGINLHKPRFPIFRAKNLSYLETWRFTSGHGLSLALLPLWASQGGSRPPPHRPTKSMIPWVSCSSVWAWRPLPAASRYYSCPGLRFSAG